MKKWIAIILCLVLSICPLTTVTAAPAADAPLLDGAKLVTFGDSITALSTWPYAVAKGANMDLYNEGIGGNTTAHGRDRFERDVLAHDPDFVIISFGTNDFYVENGAARVSVADYKTNLQYFISEVKAIGGTPILMTPPFLRSDALTGPNFAEGSPNAALDTYVSAMRDVATSTGTYLIDIHAVCDNGGYDPSVFLKDDGIHLADQGNTVYADTILGFLQDNFRQDPTAPRVTTNDPQAAAEGRWTKSLISYDTDDWLVLFPGTAYGTENADGSISFANTNGEWPELHYSPRVCETFYVPVEGSYLTIDLELKIAANISLHFGGPTPTCEYYYNAFSLAYVLREQCPWIKTSGYDISGGQDIRCTIPLSAIVPSDYIYADGTALCSGVKLLVSGAKDTPITFNELSVTTAGTAPAKRYADKQSLLPVSSAVISQNDGVVDYTVNGDGSLTINRSAESALAWPSIKVTCGQTIDLHETPYLHLKLQTNGGTANGYLNYTDAYGNSGEVQISQMVDGTANDLAADTDIVVDLAAAIRSGGTITLDSYTLSVCAVAGEGLTWTALSTAAESVLKGDMDGNGELSTTDARALLLTIAKSIVMTEQQIASLDVNGDGAVNTSDVRVILKTLVTQ